MKVTIYELLGLIKDGKAPKKISIRGNIFDSYSCSSIECYYRDFSGADWLSVIDIKLEDEVEILDEEDEFIDIEELDKGKFYSNRFPDDWEEEIIHKIDNLVKNQKKIIQALKDSE